MKKILLVVFACIFIAFAVREGGVYWHQLKWKSANISHYQFHLSIVCFCSFTFDRPSFPTIEVQDGKIVSITDEKGRVITKENEFYSTFAITIDDFFSRLHSLYVLIAGDVAVKYDPTYGFPSYIRIDRNTHFSDDERTFYISEFEVLP